MKGCTSEDFMPTEDFGLLTMAEVALLLHCSKAHICNIVAGRVQDCPRIPAVRLGRRLLVRRETLQQWIDQNEAGRLTQKVG